MYTSRQLEELLASLPEEPLSRDIVIPLLREMGYKDVRFVHGMFEHGVDILCTEETPLGTEFCGFQVKAVSISGSKRAKKGNVTELINQAASALRHRFVDDRDNTEKSLDKYVIMTSGSISDASADEIGDSLREFGRTLRFVDGQALARHMQEHLLSYVTDYFARRDLVAEFCHILRTPLQGIAADLSWLSSMLSRADAGEKALLACDRAESHTLWISRLVRSYVRAVAAPKTLGTAFRTIHLEHLVRSIVQSFKPRAAVRSIRFEVQSEQVPPISTDPDALELALANLIDNAINFSHDKETITLQICRQEGRSLVGVENLGLLIPESEIPFIWDKYYRGRAAGDPTSYTPGIGVGLAVAKELIEELGGTIEVICHPVGMTSSSPSGIVRFTIVLPDSPK